MKKLIAIDYEILRGVKANGRISIPLPREPKRVATLVNEALFQELQCELLHWKTVFLEDRMHDWDWTKGQFRYYSRVAEEADVLVVYKLEEKEVK